jgi:hypothetical protein
MLSGVFRTVPGSGSLEQDSPLSVVAMKKEKQTGLIHDPRLGKRQRHADKTGQALPQTISCLFLHVFFFL